MARIRTIKPDFWTDGAMVQLSPFARLLYIGMWNFTMCDHGHVADDPMKLKLQILPMDNVDISGLLAEILNAGRVTRVEDAEGRKYLHIKRFEDHQKIDPRWKTRCPACAQKDSLKPTETPVSLGELPETPQDSRQLPLGRDGKGWEGKKTSPATQDEFDQWYSKYPKKEAKESARKAFDKARKRASLDELIAGLERYIRSVQGKDRQFIALPATWLNAGRWMDEGAGESGDIDPDAILGPDYWMVPMPPAGMSIQGELTWKKARRAEHEAERMELARKKAADG